MVSDPTSAGVVFLGITVPTGLSTVTHARKTQRGESWTLTTKNGIFICNFASETELDDWWRAFQESQGRPARPCLPLQLTRRRSAHLQQSEALRVSKPRRSTPAPSVRKPKLK